MESRSDFETFLSKLPTLIRENRIWPNPPGNESAHDPIALAIRQWLSDAGFPHILHAEGLSKHGIPPVPQKYRGRFAGSSNWPDIALIHPQLAVAIEVDRARGKGGASLRTAMTKGSFNVLTGRFDQCHVLIFQEGGCRIAVDDDTQAVLGRFREVFHTEVHFFEAARDAAVIISENVVRK